MGCERDELSCREVDMNLKKNMTMAEFARLIGLSRPTMSRYFSDPTSVRAKTRKTIETALEKYNFSPNFLAAGLTRGHIRAFGIIVPSIIDSFYSELVSTIEQLAEDHGFLTVLQSSHNDPRRERRAVSRLMSMDVAGMAIAPLGYSSDVKAIMEARLRMPVVIVDSRLKPGVPYIGTDNSQSVSLMVDYLCRCGPPPALFTMPPINVNVVERRNAYCSRMKALGYQPRILNPDDGGIGDDYERYGYERFMTLGPDRLSGVESILCPNDRVAFGMMAAARLLDLSVGKGPNDTLRIAGHDGQHFGRYASPSLTTVAQDIRGMGAQTVEALLEGKDHPAFHKDILLNGSFVDRNSA